MKNRINLSPIIIFAIFFMVMTLIQFSTVDLPDNDGFYHIKMAWLMRTEGLKPNFSWLPLTILNPREFYDHHFLFHVALIPFTFGDLVLGAKWAAIFFASLAFLAVWYLFERQKINYSWLWSLAILGISEAFIYRMSIPRAQSLSLGVLALGLSWMLDGKYFRLLLLSFLYVWLYDAFPLIMALAVLYVVAAVICEQRLDLRPIIYVGLGLLLGMLVNPYFPFNIIFAYRHLFPKLIDATAISVGNEWYPYSTGQLLSNSFPSLIFFCSGIFAVGYSGRKMDLRTTLSLLSCLLFGAMLMQARRFVEYFPPFVLIFSTFAWQPILQNLPSKYSHPTGLEENNQHHSWSIFFKELIKSPVQQLPAFPIKNLRLLSFLCLFLVILTGISITIPLAQKSIRDSKSHQLYAGASAWLEQNTPSDARVFQTDWDDFPRLFFFNTHNTYIVGLDPTYLQLSNPDLYALWEKITQGEVKNLSVVIPQNFGANYIHTDLNHKNFIDLARKDTGLREVFHDNDAIIFEVIPK